MSLSVQVKNASLQFEGRPLFDGLNFDLAGGEWTCLLGASGVGKTTLIRLIAGLIDDHSTTGEVITGDSLPLEKRVAWMAQQDLLLPWLTVLENVMLGSRLRNQESPDETDRAMQLIKQVGLSNYERELPAALSGGMRQRAALARTLMEDRPVTLMDEPFAQVDAITRYGLQELSAELLAGRTTLLVTHDPMEALRVGHVLYVLNGRPARVSEPIRPPGSPVRTTEAVSATELHGALLETLRKDMGAVR